MKYDFVLIGGGLSIGKIALALKNLNKNFYVILHPSHGNEMLDFSYGKKKSLLGWLEEMNIQTYVLSRESEVYKLLKTSTCRYVLGLGPRWIFSSKSLELPSRWINININKIPEYLGGAHISWQIMNRDRGLIVTFQEMTANVDRGPVLKQYQFAYPVSSNKPIDYLEFNALKATEAFLDFINYDLENDDRSVQIDWSKSTYWPRLRAEAQGWINWSWRAEHIVSFIKAFSEPYGRARTLLNDQMVLIDDAEISEKYEYHPFAQGLILRKVNDVIFVASRGAMLKINIDSSRYGNQRLIVVGRRLFTPMRYLEDSMMYKVSTETLNGEMFYGG